MNTRISIKFLNGGPLARGILGLSLLASLLQPAALTAKEEWLQLLPAQTVGVLTIKNTPELVRDWDGSAMGRFLTDPAVVKWLAPVLKDGEAPWDKFMKESAGESLRAHLGRYPGASMLAILWPDEALDPSEISFFALSEMASNREALIESVKMQGKKRLEQDASLKQGEEDVAGVKIHYVGNESGSADSWSAAWAEVDGVLVESNNRETLSDVIQAMRGRAADGAGGTGLRANLKRFRALAEGEGDIGFFLDGTVLFDKLMAMSGAGDAGQAGNPFSPQLILGALSLNEITGLGVSIDLDNGSSRADVALLHRENPQGLIVKLLHGVDTRVEFPGFVPAEVSSASSTRWSLLGFYDHLMEALNQLGPMVGGMVQMQLGTLEQQMGFKLRDDLFAATDDEIISIGDVSRNSGEAGQLVVIKLKDATKFASSLEKLKKMAGSGADVFEESSVAGFKVWTMKAALPGAGQGTAQSIAYSVANDRFVLSMGPTDVMGRVLARLADPSGVSFWDDASIKAALGGLPANATGMGVSDGSAIMRQAVTALISAFETATKNAPKSGNAGQGKAVLDPDAMPGDEVFGRYFGKTSTGSYSLPDAAHYRAISSPAAGQ